ncbi:unnamed protein product [Clonostachys rosea]|uniref:Uncharacterized protein n=1 Tax=Bionectria ochroleuca TaxID=29856 RepID=A0ABY6ULL8_BIOOC|nr:unnamed protein product [Clonostachys rosea]
MTKPKYYIGAMGNLCHTSQGRIFPSPEVEEANAQASSTARRNGQSRAAPILRLRLDDVGKGTKQETQIGSPEQSRGGVTDTVPEVLDGPWIRHPDEIKEDGTFGTEGMRDDITIEENRKRHKEELNKILSQPIADRRKDFLEVLWTTTLPEAVDMTTSDGVDEELLDLMVERWYANAPLYLQPGMAVPPKMRDRCHHDWSWNARGVYYRHYYLPEWVTGDHSLWVPTLNHVDWDDRSEEPRRMRAKTFLRHALDNGQWRKSEYAWEADAWNDVFGQMRNDPTISADKHEYYTMRSATHPVSCLSMEQSKFITRIPDATFGLATFQPKHYQNAIASYDLDARRLQALALHRNCGLLSDPRWGDSDLVFPFAVYEAKGWGGDPREARRQACSAAAAYLDLLDALARHPGREGKRDGAYQTTEGRSSQVFALTSFGAHWHVLVGYRRPRLVREYAKRAGMSQNVYVFQRIWSGRISSERKAWELLSIVDQIHEWGVTVHRDFVIRHLKPWHEFCKRSYVNDVQAMHSVLDQSVPWDGRVLRVRLPAWTKHLTTDAQSKLQKTTDELFREAYRKYRPEARQKGDSFSPLFSCILGSCGPFPGYPMSSPEETVRHYRICHEIEVDIRLTRQLHDPLDEEGERTDGERIEEKAADEEGREETKHCPTAAGLSCDPTGQKKRVQTEDDDSEALGPTSHKKARL